MNQTYSITALPGAVQQPKSTLLNSSPASSNKVGLQSILDLYAPNTKRDMRVKQRWQGGAFTSAPTGFNAGRAGRFVNSTDFDYYNQTQANNKQVLENREARASADNMNKLFSQNPFNTKLGSSWGLPQFNV